MEDAGYGKKNGPGNNCEVLLDGHTSRWTYRGLLQMMKRGFFPYCYSSHTSAWVAPNDDGANAMVKAIEGRVIHDWRVINIFSVFDRAAYNRCLVKAVDIMRQRLATNLSAWQAKKKAWEECCAEKPESLTPLQGKPGNVITRAWARCGWHPLKCRSENWEKVLGTLGARYQVGGKKTTATKTGPELQMLATENKSVAIRELAYAGFNDNFLQMAKSLQEAHDRRKRRKHTSLVDTRTGRGFTCAQDIQFLREAEAKKQEQAEVICIVSLTHSLTHSPLTTNHSRRPNWSARLKPRRDGRKQSLHDGRFWTKRAQSLAKMGTTPKGSTSSSSRATSRSY
jgi:hypothetical protein